MISIGETIMKQLLQQSIETYFIDNYKPSWLGGLELDRYYPSLRTAFEFQGDQHFRYSFAKHKNHNDFFKQLYNDKKKKRILHAKDIKLIEVTTVDLGPDQFRKLIASNLPIKTSELSSSDALKRRVENYKKWLHNYYQRELKESLSFKLFHDFFSIPKIDEVIEKLFSLKNVNLSLKEKRLLLVLSLFSEGEEVKLSIEEFKNLMNESIETQIYSLTEKKIIVFQPTYGLIKIKPEVSIVVRNFAERVNRAYRKHGGISSE